LSTNDPHGGPQYQPVDGRPTGPEPQPAYGGRQGDPGGPNGYGYQQQQGYSQSGYHQPGPYGYQQSMQRTGTQPGVPVGFGEAIKRFFAKYAQFSGRASRSEYWWVALFFFLVSFVLNTLVTAVGTDSFGELNGFGVVLSLVLFVFALGTLVPSLAVAVRRLHDVNLSGWMLLLGLIPFVGWIVLIVLTVLPPKPEGARFDR
jgi:uncharacterized membrane protein YhaH (DUF805 family)